jgi:transposase-like protein
MLLVHHHLQQYGEPMNILERAKEFVQELLDLDQRSAQAWRTCPYCKSVDTILHGHYPRRPWSVGKRLQVPVQRHLCHDCQRTYSERVSWLIYKSWYTRPVHRMSVDISTHDKVSLRRTAGLVRSLIAHQEHWLFWHATQEGDPEEKVCFLSASTIHRWMGKAGAVAKKSVKGQLKGIHCSGEMGTDGLWARLRKGLKRVGLMLIDYQTGLIFPPVVVEGEEGAQYWAQLFDRAVAAGLALLGLNGLTSDGSQGLLSYLRANLPGVHQQRCVWHLWRNAAGIMRRQIAETVKGMAEKEARKIRQQLKRELSHLLHSFFDAASYESAEQALADLAAHACGKALVEWLRPLQDAALMHLMDCHQGLKRVSPEWYWRDFRQGISRGRNHGSEERLEQALLIWAIYRNFRPAQRRSERKRHYQHPGQSPLQVAGAPPGRLSYLDALGV